MIPVPFLSQLLQDVYPEMLLSYRRIPQGGRSQQTVALCHTPFKLLVDTKSRRDLMPLAQADLPGKTHANNILWTDKACA